MRLPVTVIAGYLGAGKTTLINQLLRNNEGWRLAVLVNEFGELPIDSELIEAQGNGVISISGGCVCCAFGSDLIGALDGIKALDPPVDHVLIEASGVALPGSIIASVGLVDGLRADAVVVLADAEQIRRNATDPYLGDTILRQLAQADIMLLTKSDLVTNEERSRLLDWLRSKAPQARLLPVSHGEVPISAVVGALPVPARGRKPAADAHGQFSSLVLTPGRPIDVRRLAQALADDPGVTRAKGFVLTEAGLVLLHVVGHRYSVEAATGDHSIGVVCIGLKGRLDVARLNRAKSDAEVAARPVFQANRAILPNPE
ncbi:CobW family GTP-binding protein [Paracoccus alkanivorans]|uniref:GTP-binding protein n=1 Tax=Paracoccus alkanivorans TaxID=2116655 RepID=A0A3M0MIU8_9RHOB|nr:GTP-binding protein [Paracoccus alkanivorans]RMC31167.1 GTP-binding protein [Paracoccus alkanivorans]